MSEKNHLNWLVTVPASDVGFKSALEEAPLEVLNEALDARAKPGNKTAYNAIRREIRNRLEEGGLDHGDVPTFDDHCKTVAEAEASRAKAAKAAEEGADQGPSSLAYITVHGFRLGSLIPVVRGYQYDAKLELLESHEVLWLCDLHSGENAEQAFAEGKGMITAIGTASGLEFPANDSPRPLDEELKPCPKCNTPNFTKRGLRAHMGRAFCLREIARRKEHPAQTPAPVSPVTAADSETNEPRTATQSGVDHHDDLPGNEHGVALGGAEAISPGPDDGGHPAGDRREEVQEVVEAILSVSPVEGRTDDHGPGSQLALSPEVGPAGQIVDPRWQEVRRFAEGAAKFEKCKLACQVMAGLALVELRKDLGITQGKRTDLNFPNNLGSWPELVKQHAGVSDETARNWMEMAKAAMPRIKKEIGAGFRELPLLEPSKLTAKETDTVEAVINKITNERSQLDFMRELGLLKKPQGSAATGGAKPTKAPTLTPQEQAERKAQDIFTPLQMALFKALHSKADIIHLPIATPATDQNSDLTRIRDLLAGVLELTEAAIEAKKKAFREDSAK